MPGDGDRSGVQPVPDQLASQLEYPVPDLVGGGLRSAARLPIPDTFPAIPTYTALTTSLKLVSKSRADSMLGMWLNLTEDDADILAKRLKPRVTGASRTLLEHIERWTSSLSEADRYAVIAEVIGSPGAIPGQPALRAIGLDRLSDQDAAELIIARYNKETNNEGRRRVLQLWLAASISRESARRRLVLEVLVPMLKLNSEATEKAIAFVTDLAQPIPQGTKRKLGEAIFAGTRDAGMQGRGEKLLRRLGYREERSGILGTRKSFRFD